LAGASTPTPPPVPALVEADLLEDVPPDVEALRSLLPRADVYLQDEVQFAFHPTLTRVWCWKGRRGQRLVEAPGANDKVYGFGLVDGVRAGLTAAWPQVARRISFALRCGRLSPGRAPAGAWRW
jgi:hypothetical protein